MKAWAVLDLVIAGAPGLGLTRVERAAIAALAAARSIAGHEQVAQPLGAE